MYKSPEKELIERTKTEAYKAIDRIAINMRNRRYEIKMNTSGKRVFLSINNRDKLLAILFNCLIHQEPEGRVCTIDVYTGENVIETLSIKQMQSIVSMLDNKNDDIDRMLSKYYKRIREADTINKLKLVTNDIIEAYNDEVNRYFGSMG